MATLDKDRKKELNDFYEKQKAQQRAAPTSTADTGLRRDPRLGDGPKWKEAYNRDPNLLFRSEDPTIRSFPAPMNNSQSGHTGAQPVKYTKVALVQKMGQFAKDTTFEVATVNFFTGQVKLFRSENEFFQNIHVFNDVVRVKARRTYNNKFYIHGIMTFLERGHSLLDPSCRCIHIYEEERARELGISLPMMRKGGAVDRSSIRDDKCELPKVRVPRTAQELANEIAVGDLYSVVDSQGERLVDAIAESPKIAILNPEPPHWHRFAFRATYNAVSNKQELLMTIDGLDKCLKEPSDKDMYNGVKTDLEALAEEKQIYLIYNAEAKSSVIFPRKKHLELDVDDDIKDLWRENKPPEPLHKSIKVIEELERLLRDKNLTPTQQAARKEDPTKRDKKKRRRTVKKVNKHAHLTIGKG